MRVLDKYILGTFITTFLAAVFLFFFLYVIIDLFGHLDEILKNESTASLISSYYLAFGPKIFVEIAPIAALLGIVFTLSRFNNSNEIIAMRAAGLSIFQIVRPALIAGVLIGCFSFFVNEKLVPDSQYRLNEIKSRNMGSGQDLKTIKNATIFGLDNRLFFIGLFEVDTNNLYNIVVFEQDENQNVEAKIVASSGTYKQSHWIFYDTVTYSYGSDNQIKGEPEYARAKVMDFKETPSDLKRQQLQVDYMNVPQLVDYRQRLLNSNAVKIARNFEVDIHRRFALPLSVIVLMLISIPFSLSIKKKGQFASSLGIAIALGFFYFVINSMSIAFGREGILTPWLSAWLANLCFFLMGITLISGIR